jgi:hypothetical protein
VVAVALIKEFDLNLLYDAAVLQFGSVDSDGAFGALGGSFGADPLWASDTGTAGDLGFQASALVDDATVAANQSNSFLLFTITLTGLADGKSTFRFGPSLDFERNFVGRDFQTLSLLVGSACISVGTGTCDTDLPEPGSFALLGRGLIGLGLSRRRSTTAGVPGATVCVAAKSPATRRAFCYARSGPTLLSSRRQK